MHVGSERQVSVVGATAGRFVSRQMTNNRVPTRQCGFRRLPGGVPDLDLWTLSISLTF